MLRPIENAFYKWLTRWMSHILELQSARPSADPAAVKG